MKIFWIASIGLSFVASNAVTAAPIYDAVQDFSGTSNPNGAWSYLSSANNNALMTTSFTPVAGSTAGWISGTSYSPPNTAQIVKNTSNSTLSYFNTVVQPVNLLRIDGEVYNATVRWTAPTAGNWTISGLFQGIDTNEGAHNVEILENSSVVIMGPSGINLYGAQAAFNSTLFLNAGATIDFIQLTGNGGNFLSTGLSATITNLAAVPEPSSFLATGTAALVGCGSWLRRRRRTPAA